MFVDGACGSGGDLALFLGLFLDFCNLLSLLGRSTDLHTQDDVSDLGLCQGGHIDTVCVCVCVGEGGWMEDIT